MKSFAGSEQAGVTFGVSIPSWVGMPCIRVGARTISWDA
jgi:hypothetical protein